MENYLKNANSSCFSFRFNHIRNIGELEIQDVNVISVGAFDAPETKILFDIIYEVEMYVYDDDRYQKPLLKRRNK